MPREIDHIAIAVSDLDASIALYRSLFQLEVTHREEVESFGVEVATLAVGKTEIELLAATSEASPIHKFVQRRGPGLHHIAFAVEDIRRELARLKKEGVRLIDDSPRRGKGRSLVAFIHPGSAHDVLYELVQRPA
ncbi:MAG: methylmalonyl-CoA epimerase [Candidatus Krumholzibacteriia bacterium]